MSWLRRSAIILTGSYNYPKQDKILGEKSKMATDWRQISTYFTFIHLIIFV